MGSRAEGPLMALAKHYGVNAKKIEAEIKAQFGQEEKAPKPKKATTETGNCDKCSLRKCMASSAKGVKEWSETFITRKKTRNPTS